ncbi:unnamed protein product [Symbiodinium necroappetens]|uniref:Uncharacterized protein n=1 Tax=Symbiodinium necroappetens TaxID=1628268 RepID=A0A813BNF7_9DINO|nr:unnamed protein product [Symbiodinium necroappetens]
MAATLVEVVRHILRGTLHATSVRNELSEVGELLEDVVADFGASIRLRDSTGIAEGRDALMEAVNILDEIVMNYDAAHDEFTMDPATLQDDLLRLAQQLQIVVPAHNNLLGDIRGELPSQRPSSNAQGSMKVTGTRWALCNNWGENEENTMYSDPKHGPISSDRSGGNSITCLYNVAMRVSTSYSAASTGRGLTRRGTQKRDIDAPSSFSQCSSMSSPKVIAPTDNAKQMQYGCS